MLRRFPSFDFSFIVQFRREAIKHLRLEKGDRVLDVGCGTGASFPHLVEAVGAQGEVVGIEISSEIANVARMRIQKEQLQNVNVVESSAQDAKLPGLFDGVIMFGANEMITSEESLENIFSYLKDNSRVVVMGARTVEVGWRRLLNPLFRVFVSKLSFPSTARLDYKPWQRLEQRLNERHLEEYAGGFIWVLWGSVSTKSE